MRLFVAALVALGAITTFLVAAACSGGAPATSGGGKPDASVASDANPLDDAGPGADDAEGGYGFTTPDAWDQTFARPSDDAAVSSRSACTFARGAMPAQTLGASTPIGAQIPIDTIVVVMMENRSFDSMFGHLDEYGSRKDVQEPPPGASNPAQAANWDAGVEDGGADAGSTTFPWEHAPAYCFADTDHSWKGQHWAWDDGLNDGFYAENDGNNSGDVLPPGVSLDGERAMWWYDQTDLPFEYALANTFAIGDNYFCSVLGPTLPNRNYLMAATSFGQTESALPVVSQNVVDDVVVPDELEQRSVSWGSYGDGTTSLVSVLGVDTGLRYPQKIRFAFGDFLLQAAAGTLPHVAWVDPAVGLADGTVTNNDDHPPADVQLGSQFLSQVYQAVTTSPQWAHIALFITWDENGGEYDHLPPSPACVPDDDPPILTGTDVGVPGAFDRYGFRVPLIVVSPYAKKGYASHGVYDHTSIARFIEARFALPALTGRDANADPLMDLFDFTDPPSFLSAPSMPAPILDDAGLQSCIAEFGQ